MLDEVLRTIDHRRDESLAGLKQFLAIPSISAQPNHKADMLHCSEWLAEQLRSAKLDVSILPTAGHPVVVAKNQHQRNRPTVLFYGHYDVQPPEPLEQWITPPFQPTVRNDALFARGSADDKGQVWCHIEAIKAWQQHGGMPVNLIVFIEGEEEIGSEHLDDFIRQHRDLLRADIMLISDSTQFAKGLPAITYGLRGLSYAEIFLTGPGHDLHSGQFGGAVPNPANVLCELVASLHDADGRVNMPGFYDDVVPLTAAERQMWQRLPFSEQEFAASLKIPHGNGEKGFTSIERKWARPTCDVNGITTGYQGPGSKTVIPAKASAKISMRLVPNQQPLKVKEIFESTIRARCPDNVTVEFQWHGFYDPVVVPMDSRPSQLAAESLKIGFGTDPVFMREGGSIGVVAMVKRTLGIDTLLVGFGLPDDRVHSPNEKFDLDSLHNGTRTAAALYAQLAKL